MSYTLGIDIGTFESKGAIVDGSGNVVATAARPHKMLVPQPGWAEHRPKQDWWGDFCFISKKMLAESGIDPKAIKAIGTSAIGPCMLPVDAEGEALSNAALYGVDNRAVVEIEELTERIGATKILDRCGNALTTQSVGPKILWLKKNRPELYEKAAKVVTSTTYLVQKLTGECVVDHYSAANFSPLYEIDVKGWSAALAPDIIEPDRLPKVLWTTDIAGQVTKKAARETGLAAGTPVIAGTIDAAAEALSVGVTRAGDMMVMYGSTIFIIMLSQRRIQDGRLWYAPWLFPGEHASMSGLATSGTLTHWFRDQFAKDLPFESAFRTLTKEAEKSPPGANGVIMLPHLSGERTPIHDSNAKGVIFGLNLTHGRGDLYRAAVEGIACGTNWIFETYREIGEAPKTLLAVGGGTKNPVWLQATSDVSGMPQTVRERSFGASYGDAFLAALAIGAAKKSDIGAWNPTARKVSPRGKFRGVYDKQYSIFKRVYGQTKDLMAELS
ncbi:FGGY-family carbohydrate kinase [Mesorhizobium sp. LHD-90]|uniref:FGGY-family carbohydrate kinase n=1 Tax=Mesorhizobium sp. LHD-90 TaxID=3071414 RepID=UPI0027E1C7D9|nr:FGGY-family carbohydrate kinase [Mesorhizobium sp. LHD-90]MDQ6435001.1 FGGY-family carbohydrate kinase [Mesorhizobium sp. LHD-90]